MDRHQRHKPIGFIKPEWCLADMTDYIVGFDKSTGLHSELGSSSANALIFNRQLNRVSTFPKSLDYHTMTKQAHPSSGSDVNAPRAALAIAVAQRLKPIAQGAEHELEVSLSVADAMAELIPLLDRLLAIGDTAFVQNTEEGMQQAYRVTLDGNVLIRVNELRHAVGATMDYAPSASDERTAVIEWLSALRNLKAKISPETIGEATPNNPAHRVDARYLESLIDGSADLFSPDVFTNLEPMFFKYPDGSEMCALRDKAALVYSDSMVAKAKEVLNQDRPQLIDVILDAMRKAQFAGCEAAVAEVERLQGRFDLCGWAELRLTIERDSYFWGGFLQAAKAPGANRIFQIVSVGENDIELAIFDMKLTSQGSAVHTCALTAALAVLNTQLGVSGWVNTVID